MVLQYVKQKVDERYHPDGYNIGINVNEVAGQSVFHVHMHLIPRYKGDVPNPKGGVRVSFRPSRVTMRRKVSLPPLIADPSFPPFLPIK